MITPHSKLLDILAEPALASSWQLLFPESFYPRISRRGLALDCLQGLSPAHCVQDFADGLNFVVEQGEKREVFHPVGKAGFFYFPAEQVEERPLYILCAGGGYESVAHPVEAFPVARALQGQGASVASFHYRCGAAAGWPAPLEDVAVNLEHLLEYRSQQGLTSRDYILLGFSAGGHLAGLFASQQGYGRFGLPAPKGMILAYPLVSMGEYTHPPSRRRLLGIKKDTINVQRRLSLECQVGSSFPPTFVWYCENDKMVDSRGTHLLVQALEQFCIPHRVQRYRGEHHGIGLATGTVAEGWLAKAVEFIEETTEG